MPAQLELEEEVVREDQVQFAAERRQRNAAAIAEVVGRNPVQKPPDTDPSRSPRKVQPEADLSVPISN